METVPCALCGADQPQSYQKQTDRFSKQTFTLIQCARCELIYLNPRPDPTALQDYYPVEYDSYYEIEDAETARPGSIQHSLNRQLDFVEKHAPRRARILDVGCAMGNFLRIARKNGWETSGIEFNARIAALARERYNLDVTAGTLETIPLPAGKFDVVTFWDVLEHVPSPLGALARVHRILKPGGVVVFSIPNLKSFDRHLFRSSWIGWDTPRHFTLFSDKTIRIALSQTGFTLKDRACITGGKGTFFLSLDIMLDDKPYHSLLQRSYPILGLLLWPYRQIAYALRRGPIITYSAQKDA